MPQLPAKTDRSCLLLAGLNILMILAYFYPIIGQLNTVMLSGGGDGIKNYFTYLYFIRYDQGTLFTGMNYPFGEHIVFTDNIPLLSWPMAQLRQWIPGITSYGLLVLHSAFLLSYTLAAFFLHRILALYGVKGWWAAVSAVFIAYFSPQFLRLSGHFALGFSCFFPMMIYWIMQYERSRKYRYLCCLYLATMLFVFVHVYHLAFSLVLVMAYGFAWLVSVKQPWLAKLRYLAPLLAMPLLAVLSFRLLLLWTDPVRDRPVYPIGYLGAGTTGEDILTSAFSPLGSAFRFLFGRVSEGSEGYTYPGLAGIGILLFLVYRVVRSIAVRIAKKRRIPSHPLRGQRVWLIVALAVLLFSMGVPFVWGLDFLVDYFATFRQFRTLGRFAWIFYYLVMIYGAIFLYRYARLLIRRQKRYPVQAAVFLLLAVYGTELYGYARQLHRSWQPAESNYRNFFSSGGEDWNTWLSGKGWSPGRFQAVAGLPYFHIGSEKLGLQRNDYPTTMNYSARLCMQTGLGMTDVMMSRTSWSQSFEQVAFYDGPFTPKPLARRLDMRPLLLLVNTHHPLSEGEQYMLRYARLIGRRWDVDLYTLNVADMLAGDRRYTDSCIGLALQSDRQEGLLPPAGFSYSAHFDHDKATASFAGAGALPAGEQYKKPFLTVPFPADAGDSLFIFSTWMHCFPGRPEMPSIYFEELDARGNIIYSDSYFANHSNFVLHHWYKAEQAVPVKKGTRELRFYASGGRKEYLALDELLIRPAGSLYFYKASDSLILLNNRPVPLNRK